MAFTPFAEDMNIIAKLQDEPNDADGLTADELKARFDAAGLTVQQYINESLLPDAQREIADALESAKGYTDQKVVAIGAGDMTMAVYDPARKRADVFAYTDTVAKAQADAVRGEVQSTYSAARWYGKDLIATSSSGGDSGTGNGSERTYPIEFDVMHDPLGMVGTDKRTITVPQGATRLMMTNYINFNRTTYLEVSVNGIIAVSRKNQNEIHAYVDSFIESWIVLDVKAGDRITVALRATCLSGMEAAWAYLRRFRLEVLG